MAGNITGGQIFGAVIGAVLMAVFPPAGVAALSIGELAMLGASIGMGIGGILDPPEGQTIKQEGPRLGDLSAQTSEWGSPIRRLFGTYKMSGNVIWSLDIKETKHVEESGEGKGGGGTKTETTWYSYSGSWACGFCEGPVSGITKIWFDSVLVFDGSRYSGGLSTANHSVYLGTNNQEINWYMQQSGDTPGYRNLCYLVFMDIELENYGNKIPNVSIEVAKDGEYVGPQLINKTLFNDNKSSGLFRYSTTLFAGNGGLAYVYSNRKHKLFSNGVSVLDSHDAITNDFGHYNEYIYPTLQDQNDFPNPVKPLQSPTGSAWAYMRIYFINGEEYHMLSNTTDSSYYAYLTRPTATALQYGEILIDDVNIHDIYPIDNGFLQLNRNDELWYLDLDFNKVSKLDLDWGLYEPVFTTHPQLRTKMIGLEGDTLYLFSGSDTYLGTMGTWRFYTLNLESNTLQYIGGFYDGDNPEFATYAAGMSFSVQNGIADISVIYETHYYYSINLNAFLDDKVTIGSISRDLFLRAGLTENDFDVSEGVDLVNGYVVTQPMDTRSAITNVISAYSYELIESNSKLILKKRDPIPVLAVDEADIIKFVEINRIQTQELSRQISIMYANRHNNYNVGSQSTLRNDVDVVTNKVYQFPLALSDDEAKKISERYLYSEWNERLEFKFNLTSNYLDLLPSDVISLNYEGNTYLVRLTKVDYLTDKSINFEASLENSTILESTAVGSDTGSVDNVVATTAPTKLEVLDIPMLDNSVNIEGVYLAVKGYIDGWTACAIHKSNDLGLTYTKVLDMFDESPIGEANTVLANGTSTVWDYNEVTVYSLKALYSLSEENVLNGGNYILLGDEVLQYATATDIGDNKYTLTKLLRGRRGTEWAMNAHTLYERFVVLSNSLSFDSTASLNVESYYKATTFGLFIDDSDTEIITPEIRCLKPFSPSYVRGTRDVSNNLTITWMRRSRDVTGYFKTLSLMEEQELYEIDILDSGDNVVATKYIQNEQEYVYSNADQLTDIPAHTTGDPVKINIYQVSGIVQRGYVTEEIL